MKVLPRAFQLWQSNFGICHHQREHLYIEGKTYTRDSSKSCYNKGRGTFLSLTPMYLNVPLISDYLSFIQKFWLCSSCFSESCLNDKDIKEIKLLCLIQVLRRLSIQSSLLLILLQMYTFIQRSLKCICHWDDV